MGLLRSCSFVLLLVGRMIHPASERVTLTGTDRQNTLCKASRMSDTDQNELVRLIVKELAVS